MHVLVAGVFLAAVLTASVAVATMLIDVVGVSRSLDVGLALAGLCAGIWVGWWASRGWSGVGGLLIQAAAATAFAVAGGLWLTSQIVQAQPYDITLPKVNSADKRELVNAVRQHSELRDGHHIYHLTTEQLNKLLAWWIAFQSVDSKAMVQLTDDEQQACGSLRLPARISPRRPFLNLAATGRCEITDEKLEMDIRSAQVGAIAIPGPITRYASRLLARWVNDDPVNVDLLVGVSAVITHKHGVDVYVSDDGLQHRRWAKMLRQTNSRFDRSDVSSAIRVYLDEFAQIPRMPSLDSRCLTWLSGELLSWHATGPCRAIPCRRIELPFWPWVYRSVFPGWAISWATCGRKIPERTLPVSSIRVNCEGAAIGRGISGSARH